MTRTYRERKIRRERKVNLLSAIALAFLMLLYGIVGTMDYYDAVRAEEERQNYSRH